MGYLGASGHRSQPEWFWLAVYDVAVWSALLLKRLLRKAPYRMVYSYPTTDIRRYHVDSTMSQLIADL